MTVEATKNLAYELDDWGGSKDPCILRLIIDNSRILNITEKFYGSNINNQGSWKSHQSSTWILAVASATRPWGPFHRRDLFLSVHL